MPKAPGSRAAATGTAQDGGSPRKGTGPRFSVWSRTSRVGVSEPASAGLLGLEKGRVLWMDAPGANKAPSTNSGNLKKRLPNA